MNLQVKPSDLLPADLGMGAVMLKVGDLSGVAGWYRQALGLAVVAEADGGLYLGRAGTPLVHLAPAPGLQVASRGEAGLFHTAILFPDQASLAAAVAVAYRHDPAAYVGSADHLVSEAFYFSDPEGNGVELYWDRPRSQWGWDDTASGPRVRMDSLPLPPTQYLQRHLTETALTDMEAAAADVGHVHLQVGSVETAEQFYVGVLGFEKTADFSGQALFVSAGGYHHHMAMNVWNSRGAGPRRDTLGLGEVLLAVSAADDVAALADRLAVAGISSHSTGAELRFEDPWRNRLRVTVAAG